MSKIKINSNYPENPGLINGKYGIYYTSEFDFMDDPLYYPTKESLRLNYDFLGLNGGGYRYSSGDLHTKTRAARDQITKLSNETNLAYTYNYRFAPDGPKVFYTVELDLSKDMSGTDQWGQPACAEHLMTRFQIPSMVDGSMNFPNMNIVDIEGVQDAWLNVPRKEVKVLYKGCNNWSIENLINHLDWQSGGDAGDGNVPQEFRLYNPWAGYSWYVPGGYIFDTLNFNYFSGYTYPGDTETSIGNIQDMRSFRRYVREAILKLSTRIADVKGRFSPEEIADGTAASKSYFQEYIKQFDEDGQVIGEIFVNHGPDGQYDGGTNFPQGPVTQELFMKKIYNLEEYTFLKTWFLANPDLDVNIARCTINGVEYDELKWAFVNSYVIQQMNLPTAELQALQRNPITPLEFYGDININFLPAVKYLSQLTGITGQIGDVIKCEETMNQGISDYAWDGEQWSSDYYERRFDAAIMTSYRGVFDSRLKALNELALATRPFVWASHHIPAYMITENNEIRTESDRTIFDFASFHAGPTA